MCSRCFAGRYQTALLAVASTASPTGSPKSSVKPATSRHPENGQRLAANADNPGVKPWNPRPSMNRTTLLEITEREPLRSLSSCRQTLQVRAPPVTHHFDHWGERPSI